MGARQGKLISVLVLAAGAFGALWYLFMRSAQGVFDTMTSGPFTITGQIRALASAIAKAEGYLVEGSIPKRANNPGDLVLGDKGFGVLGEGITVFNTPELGWTALYHQLAMIVSGQSHVYRLDMTLADMAHKWTATNRAEWATIVAQDLGVPVTTLLSTILIEPATDGSAAS